MSVKNVNCSLRLECRASKSGNTFVALVCKLPFGEKLIFLKREDVYELANITPAEYHSLKPGDVIVFKGE